jgi:hypothetical protein
MYKAALLTALGLASVTAAQAVTYNGDLLVGLTTQSGTDLVYDLGSEANVLNGNQTSWDLTSALTAAGLNSSLSTVQWGVVGAMNVSGTRTSWLTVAGVTPNSVDGIGAWNGINAGVGTLVVNDFSTLGLGYYATPDSGASFSWNMGTLQGAGGANGSFSVNSQDPNTTGLGSVTFWQQINDASTPTQLGAFTLNADNTLTFGITPVPEPTSAGLLVAGGCFLMLIGRNRFGLKQS